MLNTGKNSNADDDGSGDDDDEVRFDGTLCQLLLRSTCVATLFHICSKSPSGSFGGQKKYTTGEEVNVCFAWQCCVCLGKIASVCMVQW